MDAIAVLKRAVELGITLSVAGDRIRYWPKAAAPSDFVAELRRYKPELTEHLCDLAWRDIERDVLGYGACLLWSEVLDDYIAFYVTDDDRAKVPPGFVPYSHVEMLLMFGPEQADWSPEGLRKIHAAKKLGANVIEARDDGHIADASP